MDSKTYRIREFIRPSDGRSLVIDTSAGLSLGPLPGLEDFSAALIPLLPLADGVVASPGQVRRLAGRTRAEAALLVRADWTNALRGPDFVLPPTTIAHLPLLTPEEALELGASALVLTFLLGHTEQVEAECLRQTVQLAIAGAQAGMPLLVDVRPLGPRVVLRDKAIQLGVSYALEGGADGVVLPWPGQHAFAQVVKMAAGIPLWIRVEDPGEPELLRQALDQGASGVWLDERAFAAPDPAEEVRGLAALAHHTGSGIAEPVKS
jgi:DhnA family fructose-bisphosphate aldolase class Ia